MKILEMLKFLIAMVFSLDTLGVTARTVSSATLESLKLSVDSVHLAIVIRMGLFMELAIH